MLNARASIQSPHQFVAINSRCVVSLGPTKRSSTHLLAASERLFQAV
ncbi:hypothetical protein SAMN05216330_11620 [Bradyrhizobium sp. Ghvi]|nr:hypothetical protein SAMN05216330_11620 [Bradyrhizobium sp. Ghvi]